MWDELGATMVEVTAAFATELMKFEGRFHFGVTSQHGGARKMPWRDLNGWVELRTGGDQFDMEVCHHASNDGWTSHPTIQHLDELVRSDMAKRSDFRGTMICLCNTWLLRRNLLTRLDEDIEKCDLALVFLSWNK
jgi:hypothetical protein